MKTFVAGCHPPALLHSAILPSRLPTVHRDVEAQDTLVPGTRTVKITREVTVVAFHVHAVPFCETAMQKVLEAQDTSLSATMSDPETIKFPQLVPSKLTNWPPALTARQKVAEVHETASSEGADGVAEVAVQVVASKVAAVPSRLTAMQKVDDGQEIAVGLLRPVLAAADHVPELYWNDEPSELKAMQDEEVAQDRPTRYPLASSTTEPATQVEPAVVDHVSVDPENETAVQAEAVGQETCEIHPFASTVCAADHCPAPNR